MANIFDDQSRVGFEFELLAPVGMTRETLANALARRISGKVLHGFKYWSEGTDENQRPICQLTPAFRVVGPDGKLFATLVDDNTLRSDLTEHGAHSVAWILDDLRLALWAEKHSWTDKPEDRLKLICDTFECRLDESAHGYQDSWGNLVVLQQNYPSSYLRATEVVTCPLEQPRLAETVELIFGEARALGFTVPAEAALHLHFDGQPWLSVDRLSQLILDYTSQREALLATFKPNPRCKKLGPFSENMLEVARRARAADVSFGVFAAGLQMAGATKSSDINILNLIWKHPAQRTLEIRCLPMELDASHVVSLVAACEAFLAKVAENADGATH